MLAQLPEFQQVGHIVAVTGLLSHVLQKNDGKVQFFEVEVVGPGQYLGKEVCVGWSQSIC